MSFYAKGGAVELLSLPFGTDEIVLVMVQATSLPADSVFQNAQFLSQVLASGSGTGLEATFTNYGRIHIGTPATIAVNTGTGVRSADIPDQVINAAGGALNNNLGAFLVCWRKTTATADSATRLLTKHNYVYSTTGGNLPVAIPSICSAV
jgi:hypothetical protein